MNIQKLYYRLLLLRCNGVRRVRELFFMPALAQPPPRILIGAMVLLGDFVMMAPLVQAIRRQYPATEITLLAPPGFGPLGQAMKGVDRVIEGRARNGQWAAEFIRHYNHYWDLGFIPFVYFLIPLFYGVGVKHIVSFSDPKGRRAYQIHTPVPLPAAAHVSRMMLHLVGDKTTRYVAPHFDWTHFPVPKWLHGKHYVVIHPSASRAIRIWPLRRYVAIAKKLLAEGYEIILTGTASEKPVADALQSRLMMSSVHNLVGKTPLTVLAGILTQADCVIGPDTGVLHLARALNVPSVTLMGQTQKEIYGTDSDFHDTTRSKVVYVEHLSCRNQQDFFKQTLAGIANCKRETCLYPEVSCMVGMRTALVFRTLQSVLHAEIIL
ncbi:MAG TPA: glycosyltransferase family 9 protein [Coxiellaceae bacterium]|nr:glycosyltransferase family 9 protein [Coxiellaceae bacterium]